MDAEDTPGAPTQVTSEHAAASKPESLMNEENTSTAADPDPIFHAYSVQLQPCQEIERVAVVENVAMNEEASNDHSPPECNELEWDTCTMYDDNAVLVNEGIHCSSRRVAEPE